MNLKLFIQLLFTLVLVGCAHNTQNTTVQKQTLQLNKTESKQSKLSNIKEPIKYPKWIVTPNKKGYICSIGSSKISLSNYRTKKIALVTAKAAISRQIKVHIQTKSNFSHENGKISFHTKSKHQTINMVKNIKVTDEFVDTSSKRLYLRVCTKI